MLKFITASAIAALAVAAAIPVPEATAQQGYPSAEQERPRTRTRANDAYRPGPDQPGLGVLGGEPRPEAAPTYGASAPSYPAPSYSGGPPTYTAPPAYGTPAPNYGAPAYGTSAPPPVYTQGYGTPPPAYQAPYPSGPQSYGSNNGYAANQGGGGFGQPYSPPPAYDDEPQAGGRRPYMSGEPSRGGQPGEYRQGNSFSTDEIKNAGHGFFGSISQGLASVIEHTHRKKGRPNGYILGEEAGGAFVAGLRYGQGRLYTKDAGVHNIYWQGPSLGFDAGAEGSKVMILVYNLRDINETFDRFGGIDGSAYVVGGVGVTFLSKDNIVMAPIRSGVGLRFGANIGYLKFTSKPTWNPF
jgi:hypothetical protein